jgi:hypothetical protein
MKMSDDEDYDRTKELGVIENVFVGKEDHGIPTVSIMITFNDGFTSQGFGNLCLTKETQPVYLDKVCSLFGVDHYKELKGKKCYALRSFDCWNEYIEGIETLDGKRFTHTDFRYDVHGRKDTVLEQRKKDMEERIARHHEDIKRLKEEMKHLDDDYVPWSYMEQRKRKPQARKKRKK